MTNSRAKGARGEREARDFAKMHWYAKDCIRAAQSNGKWSADLLHALPGAHLEVKRYHKIAVTRYMEQASRDAQDDEFPVVLMREDQSPRWLVMFPIEATEMFVESFLTNRRAFNEPTAANQDE